MPAVFALLAAGIAVYAGLHLRAERAFRHPIAYAMAGNSLYVLEKERNTILQFDACSAAGGLRLDGRFRIERDDDRFYYMVRKLYPGPRGIVVHSYVYDRNSGAFLGYRFREYAAFRKPPRTILTVFLKDPSAFPEIKYACDREGNHYFANNCAGGRNIWKLPAAAKDVVIERGILPALVRELGDRNEALSGWPSICVGPDGRIYVSSSESERIVEYAPDGRRLREIGTVGLGEGDLLAPDEVFFFPFAPGQPPFLTVASAGNRSWVQFDLNGAVARLVAPLRAGYPYPDILVSHIYVSSAKAAPGQTNRAPATSYAFDLVNKCLVTLGRKLTIVSSYRTWEVGRTGLLGGVAVLLFLLAAMWRRLTALLVRLKIPFFAKLLLLFIPLLVVSLLVVGDWVRDIMQADLEAESVRRSANLSRAILNSVSLADLEAIQKPEDRNGPAYERIHTTVSRIMDSKNVAQTPKWIIHKIRGGRFYFGISIWRGPLYEPYVVIPRERQLFFKALKEKTAQAGRFSDEQGEWFSVLNPILNAAGEVIYILELYRPTEEIDRAREQAFHRALGITGFTALAAIGLTLLFAYLFTRPLRQLMLATVRLGRGDFEHPIMVRSRDELRDLAAAFNHMMVDLKRHIADLARSTAEKERVQTELRFAREVQQGIVPKVFPPFPQAPNVEIAARMEPAREVGGDYFDFFMIDPEHMGVVIADVSDKGVPAGLFTMIVRTLLRVNAKGNLSAADTVSRMNRQIAADNPSSMFVTLFYFIADLRTGRVTFCNAGHPAPILLRGEQAEPLPSVEGRGGCVIAGIYENIEYSEGELTLAAGETLALYTDGVTEAINQAEQMYGEERLRRVLTEGPRRTNRQRCDRVVADVMNHQQGLEQFDDITLLFFKFLGERNGQSAPPAAASPAAAAVVPVDPPVVAVDSASAGLVVSDVNGAKISPGSPQARPPQTVLPRKMEGEAVLSRQQHGATTLDLAPFVSAAAVDAHPDQSVSLPGGAGPVIANSGPAKKNRRRNPSRPAAPAADELWLPGLELPP